MSKFKVGDRVAAYGCDLLFTDHTRVVGTVTTVNSSDKTLEVTFGSLAYYTFNEKQCRKLVKPKKRREFWINVYSDYTVVHETKRKANKAATPNRLECIYVREVKTKV